MDWEKFETLSSAEQVRLLKERPFSEKCQLILHAHDPQGMTRALSQEEFYLAAKEMDVEERAEVVRYASIPQLFFMTDLECWKGDRIEPEHFIRWLETLTRAGDETLLHWLLRIDYETAVAGLKKIVRIAKPEREYPVDEILGDVPYFTLDDVYYVAVREEDLETVRRCFEVLYENHRGKYAAFLEGIMADLDDPVEEEAYEIREIRLAERGFPEKERALAVYSPLSPEDFEKFPKKTPPAPRKAREDSEGAKLPDYPVLWSKERFFLDEVLARIPREESALLEQIEEELVWISNKVLTAQGLDFSSEDKVRAGIERARCFVSIGLELLSEGRLEQADILIRERWLEPVFRSAVTGMLKLREKAEGIIADLWPGTREHFLMFMNPPYQFIFRGILRTVPQCYDSRIISGDFPVRDFRTAQDLERTRVSLDQTRAALGHLVKSFPKIFRGIDFGEEAEQFRLSFFAFLGTVFASAVIGKKTRVAPLEESQLRGFLGKAFDGAAGNRRLSEDLKRGFLESFYRPDELPVVRSLWALVFEGLDEELGRLNPAKKIDARYISTLRLRNDDGAA